MSEEFLYGCGVIPRGSNRLIHMTDSVDENASDVIASSKSVTNLKAEQQTTVDQQIQDLNSYIDTQIATLNKTISALQQADTAMQSQIQQLHTTVNNIREGLPIGHIFFSMNIPENCLACEGQTISRTEYPDLWNYVNDNCDPISDTEWNETAEATYTYCHKFSTGDGTTTFRLPKFASFIELNSNAEAGTFYSAGLPNIGPVKTGTACDDHNVQNGNSPFYVNGNGYECTDGNNGTYVMWFDASRFNSIYGNSTTVQPEAMVWVACIQAK